MAARKWVGDVVCDAGLQDVRKKIRVIHSGWLAWICGLLNFLIVDPGIVELLILTDGFLKSVDFKLNRHWIAGIKLIIVLE